MTSLHRAPTLHSTRLTMRAHGATDFPSIRAMWADPVVTRYVGGRTRSEEEAWSAFLRAIGHWALLGFGYWVVRETASDRFLGEVGFADFRRSLEPSLDGIPELGWALVPSAHGRGFATEAVCAALAWARTQRLAERVACIIHGRPGVRAGQIGRQ